MLKVISPVGKEKDYIQSPEGNGRVLTFLPVKEGRPIYMRGIAHVLLLNPDNKLLLTNRVAGGTDIGITETIEPDEEIETAARRGLEEELGIPMSAQGSLVTIALGLYVSTDALFPVTTYGIMHGGPLHPKQDEISGCHFVKPGRILREKHNYTPLTLQPWLRAVLKENPNYLIARTLQCEKRRLR